MCQHFHDEQRLWLRIEAAERERLCLCGHTAHWHGVADGIQGAGECEHDGECECTRFHPRLVGTPDSWRPVKGDVR